LLGAHEAIILDVDLFVEVNQFRGLGKQRGGRYYHIREENRGQYYHIREENRGQYYHIREESITSSWTVVWPLISASSTWGVGVNRAVTVRRVHLTTVNGVVFVRVDGAEEGPENVHFL